MSEVMGLLKKVAHLVSDAVKECDFNLSLTGDDDLNINVKKRKIKEEPEKIEGDIDDAEKQ